MRHATMISSSIVAIAATGIAVGQILGPTPRVDYGPLVIDPLGRRGGSPQPILYMEGDSATFSGSDLATWPATIGNTPSLIASCGTPSKGATVNGHTGIRFTATEKDNLDFGSVKSTASDYTIQIAWSNTRATGNRQYFLRSYEIADTDDLIVAHMANLAPSHFMAGYYDASENGDTSPGSGWHLFHNPSWRATDSHVEARMTMHVDTYVLRNGAVKLYRDGELVGTNSAYTRRRMTKLHMGAWYASDGTCPATEDVTAFDGTVYQLKIWAEALGQSDAMREQAASMARFGISTWPPANTDPLEIFGADLTCWYDLSNRTYLEWSDVMALNAVADRTNTSDVAVAVSLPFLSHEHASGRPDVLIGSGVADYLRDDSCAAQTYPGGTVGSSQAVTMFAVFRQSPTAGHESTDGPIMAFGYSGGTSSINWFDFMIYSPTTSDRIRSLMLSGSGTSRSKLSTAAIGTTLIHLGVVEQNESDDIPKTWVDGGSVESGSSVNLGSTSFDTFVLGRRYSAGAYRGSGNATVYLSSAGVVNRALTAGERTALRAWAQTVWGTP